MNKKKIYIPAEASVMEARLKSAILDGSVTSQKINVNHVTVDPYSQGFGDPSDPSSPDFKEISFD